MIETDIPGEPTYLIPGGDLSELSNRFWTAEPAADEATLVLLKRLSRNPDVEKARVGFERAQRVEERFHKDFDGLDFTSR
jgi:hypothetical protein